MGPALGQLLVSLLTLKLIGRPKSNLQTMTENLSGIDLLRCPLVIFLKISIDLGLVWDMPVIRQDVQVKLKKFLQILYTVQCTAAYDIC